MVPPLSQAFTCCTATEFRKLLWLTRKANRTPYRKADLQNLPLQTAQQRFLDQLASHCTVLNEVLGPLLTAWSSLSDSARELCRSRGWLEVQASPTWRDLLPGLTANDPNLLAEQQIHIELIPLCESLTAFAVRFGLLHKGEPAIWAMDVVLETLHQTARRSPEKRVARWTSQIEFSQEYPALAELGWTSAATGLPEEELFAIVVRIRPKQPEESFKAFERRFNKTCREARQRYIRVLKAEAWTTRPALEFKWIDYLARWQADPRTSQIDPSIKTPSQRAAFSRGLKHAGDHIGITPRPSKHNPKRRRGH